MKLGAVHSIPLSRHFQKLVSYAHLPFHANMAIGSAEAMIKRQSKSRPPARMASAIVVGAITGVMVGECGCACPKIYINIDLGVASGAGMSI